MIAPDTTVGRLLDEHPQLVEVLAQLHPHFKQLRHRLLRRVMGPRLTLAQAARMAGVPTEELLATVRRAVGEPEEVVGADVSAVTVAPDAEPTSPPGELATLRAVEVDVREDIRRGEEPFARIMAAVKALGAGEALCLRGPFEPIPLYDVLGRRGFAHWTARHAADDWSVWFYRAAPADPAAPVTPPVTGPVPPRAGAVVLDVRGLPPPQPMVVVLERLDRLAPAEALLVVHDRRPLFLYPQLEERGFVHETREGAPGRVEILIRRATTPRDGG